MHAEAEHPVVLVVQTDRTNGPAPNGPVAALKNPVELVAVCIFEYSTSTPM